MSEKKSQAKKKKKEKTLPPIKVEFGDYDIMEARIKSVFRDMIYFPLLKLLGQPRTRLTNSDPKYQALVSAIIAGKITYKDGAFSGSFSAQTSKELKQAGAKWVNKDSTFAIKQYDLPLEVQNAIESSHEFFTDQMEKIDARLREVVPSDVAEAIKTKDLFESVLWKVNKQFDKNVESIGIEPKFTPERLNILSAEWQHNLDRWVSDFTYHEVLELRSKIEKNIFVHGNRYEAAIKDIQDSYGVSARKAKFLARQETSLAMAAYTESRYREVGIDEYYWQNVIGTPEHPTRKQHAALGAASKKGKTFKFSEPPVTTEPGEPERRNNPGQDYNCFPGSTIITLDRSIDKIFRRWFSGELTSLVCDDGVVLNSTGNHPILTSRGFIAAKDIEIGDYILSSKTESLSAEKMNRKYMISSFEDMFSALRFCFKVSIDTLTETDFHNDVSIHKEVNVIAIDRKLMLNAIAVFYKQFHDFLFEGADTPVIPDGTPFHDFVTQWNTSHNLISFFGELTSFIKIHFTHTDYVGLGTSSFWDSKFFKPSSNDRAIDLVFNRYRKFTHPLLVILDSFLIHRGDFIPGDTFLSLVCDKTTLAFEGHVYNLQSVNGEYVANNRIVHNCRCKARPVVKF